MDALVGSVIFIVRLDGVRISIGAHWMWTGVEREKLVFDFGNIWVDVFDTYMSMVIGSPCPCKHLMLLLCGDPLNSSRRYRGGGTAKRGDYHDSMSHTAINLTVLSCAKVRNYYRRDRSGTAAGPQSCRRDRSRRRRAHFTCKFLGAGPQTPFGNYNTVIYQGGSGDVLEGVRIFLRMSCLLSVVFLAVFQMGSLDCEVFEIAADANPPLQRVHLQVEAYF